MVSHPWSHHAKPWYDHGLTMLCEITSQPNHGWKSINHGQTKTMVWLSFFQPWSTMVGHTFLTMYYNVFPTMV